MPSKSSSSSSSKAAGISPRAATRAATRATSPRAATRATSPRAVSPRAVSPRAAFTAAVAAKDTNRLHNIPEDIQKEIMRMAREKKINSQGKYEIYKKIYNNREVFLEWLEEIKRNGVDDKKRVRNPLRKGGLIYTNKGLYSTIVNLCIAIFPADFKWDTIPPRIKIEYKQQNKFYNKPR
jgi:hypothetical protein